MLALFAVLGLLLTLLALALLGAGGYLAAILLLPAPRRSQPLELALTTLLLALVQGVGVALALGVLSLLRFELALAAQTLLVAGAYAGCRRRFGAELPAALGGPLRAIGRAGRRRLADYPALALITGLAAGAEAARGLLRPPLSWDSLMYHLHLAATWLQQGSLDLFAARYPTSAFLYTPANGSLWTWWWMAPSHSELYVNLAHFPSWALLGLATGAFARELGARRHWPVASFLVLLAPVVLRFAATQYVDILLASCLVAASVYALRWVREPGWRDALLLGLALGLGAGTKVLGVPYGAAVAGLAAVLAATAGRAAFRGSWARRLGHLALAGVATLLLGGFFYARNVALGGGLFGYPCVQQDAAAEGLADSFPSRGSLADLWDEITAEGLLADAFLGSTRPTLADLGVGPVVFLLLAVALVLPFAVARVGRPAAWLAQGQVAVQLVLWVLVPYAASAHILANVRYLDGALALLFAGAVAIGERRLSEAGLRGLAVTLAVLDLLMLRPSLSREVRWLFAAVLAAAAALALSGRLRRLVRSRPRLLAAGLLVLAAALAPALAGFRVRDRERAFTEELTAHLTSSRIFAAGWGWLDRHAGDGAVAVSHAPENYFVYPAMGPFLERRALYVHVNEAAHENPLRYPGCDARVEPSPQAWIANLRRAGVRWLHVARFPEFDFPVEDRWARERPDLFTLRFDHPTNRVYDLLQGDAAP